MNVILFSEALPYYSKLCLQLIPMGIECIETSKLQEVTGLLTADNKINILLTDCLEKDFISKVQEARPQIFIFLLVNYSVKPSDMMPLLKMGITSVINYSDNASMMADEIFASLVYNNINSKEKRLHIRVQPKPHENITVSIYIKNLNRFVRGKVIDISAGGMAIMFNDSLESSLLILNNIYDPAIISFSGTDVKTISVLVAKRDKIAGFKFDNVESREMNIIAGYIHNKVAENSLNLMSMVALDKN